MSEAREGSSLGIRCTNVDEPLTPEPSPLRILNSDDHERMMRRQQQQKAPKKTSGSGRGGGSNNPNIALGLMLPVLEEAPADTIRTPTDNHHVRLPPLRFSPSPAYARFCQETLPSMRHFNTTNTGADPRSVIPSNNNNNSTTRRNSDTASFGLLPLPSLQQQQRQQRRQERQPVNEDNHQSRMSMPTSLCVPDISEEVEEEEEAEVQVDQDNSSSSNRKGSFLHSMRLFPKRRRRDK